MEPSQLAQYLRYGLGTYLRVLPDPNGLGCWMLVVKPVKPLNMLYHQSEEAIACVRGRRVYVSVIGFIKDGDEFGRHFIPHTMILHSQSLAEHKRHTLGLFRGACWQLSGYFQDVPLSPTPHHTPSSNRSFFSQVDGFTETIDSRSWHNFHPGETRVKLYLTRLVSIYDTSSSPPALAKSILTNPDLNNGYWASQIMAHRVETSFVSAAGGSGAHSRVFAPASAGRFSAGSHYSVTACHTPSLLKNIPLLCFVPPPTKFSHGAKPNVVAGCLTAPFANTVKSIGDADYCINDLPAAYTSTLLIIPLCYDTAVFIAISYQLLRNSYYNYSDDKLPSRLHSLWSGKHLPHFSRALFKDGQELTLLFYIAVIFMIFIPGIIPGISVYHTMLTVPNLVISNALACRVYRNIMLGYNTVSNDMGISLATIPVSNVISSPEGGIRNSPKSPVQIADRIEGGSIA
ncbi:hypothetical protein D9757_013317 [Collybiopsis confluens]|uniref:Uncharacterized protein n=1 Tax=Collybiopsis confluens TaxID=2823264 RepID=A0A8H5GCT7_9AGAR|nr:hypothetical protein D9757_013317 [Collybiopsis confluens]